MKSNLMEAAAVAAIALCGAGTHAAVAQKRPLDLDACMQWKRIDSPDVSPTGRWVTYRISMMEYNPDYKDGKTIHLFDTKTGREFLIPDQYSVRFYGNDSGISYDVTDSSGISRTMLMALPSGEKSTWEYEEPFNPVEGTPYSISSVSVPEDTVCGTPSFNRLVFRELKTGNAFNIDSVGNYSLYNKGRSILFVRKQPRGKGNAICYGPLKGPYTTLYASTCKNEPTSYSFDVKKMTGSFDIADSLWFDFSLKDRKCSLRFDISEIPVPEGMEIARADARSGSRYVSVELGEKRKAVRRKKEDRAKDDSFDLELWTWDELESPTLQRDWSYRGDPYPRYVFDRQTGTLAEVAPPDVTLSAPSTLDGTDYILYTDESPYKPMKEWLYSMPMDIYAVNIHTGERHIAGKAYRESPKWSPNGRWAVMYDPEAKVWNKFDGATGEVTDISSAIGYPVHYTGYDKPNPAPAYGIAGWTSDGNSVLIYDAYDWWKIDLAGGRAPECLTKGYGRASNKVIRKMSSNIETDRFAPEDKVTVSVWDESTMDESVCLLDMKGGLKTLAGGHYNYTIHRFSDNREYCVWTRQNISEFRDLWWSRADFSNPVRITEANPQQKDYNWGSVELVEWTNYEDKPNRGLLYLPEDYSPEKEYPVLVQFYETHSGGLNTYLAPMLSSAMADVMYFVSNGYIVFMPDVHFTTGTPGQSSYDAVVSGTRYLIDKGIAHPGRIGLQGHSWSGFQTCYLVTKTGDLFACANIGAPITDMVTGYLGIRGGSGLPRYFMYEEWQSRMGVPIWDAKDKYLANSALLEADKIRTPLLIWHNDNDEAVAYEQGRALYLAMRRLQRPAWLLNYKGQGHFLSNTAAQKDWTIRMKQFFDYYLNGTAMPRWMKEGIHITERGIDNKYDLMQ